MNDVLKSLIKQFMPFAQKQMGFDRVPSLFLKNDENEANNPMGKTGFYDPNDESITIYIGKRHPKDIMRSLSHELMHHTQKCNGDFDDIQAMGEQGYAQNNPHLRNMEIQAYQASIVFRDWEDSCKGTIYYEHLQKGDKKMSTKDWKNGELTTLLSEAFGFKFNMDNLNEKRGDKNTGMSGVKSDDDKTYMGHLKEEDEEEETRHYGEDESADKREEDELEHDEDDSSTKHHLDGIEHHLKALRKDMDYDQDHEWTRHDESAETDCDTLEEGDDEIEEASTPKRNAQGREPARRIRKEELDAIVKKAIKEVLQKRKG